MGEKEIQEVISYINNSCLEAGADFFLIGARAKDFWLSANNIKPRRFTNDIDFAVLVPDITVFEKIKEILTTKFNFKTIQNIPHRIIYTKNDLIIDLLPFGGVEQAGYINFTDKFDVKLSVLGFQEVFENAIVSELFGEKLKIASIPGLCILKLMAWADNPLEREKDILDISNMIQHFFDIESELIYQKHLDLFEAEDFNKLTTGARVLGRQINNIISKSSEAKKRITEILKSNINKAENSRIAILIAKDSRIPLDLSLSIMIELHKGIIE